jgi:hypothetical protein
VYYWTGNFAMQTVTRKSWNCGRGWIKCYSIHRLLTDFNKVTLLGSLDFAICLFKTPLVGTIHLIMVSDLDIDNDLDVFGIIPQSVNRKDKKRGFVVK